MPSFKCADIGLKCNFSTKAATEQELMKKIAEHAKKNHKMDPIPAETLAKVKKAIKK
jgi:predicted small metal-binding protein